MFAFPFERKEKREYTSAREEKKTINRWISIVRASKIVVIIVAVAEINAFKFNRCHSYVLSWVHLPQQCEVGYTWLSSLHHLLQLLLLLLPLLLYLSSFSCCSCDCIRRIFIELSTPMKNNNKQSKSSLFFASIGANWWKHFGAP